MKRLFLLLLSVSEIFVINNTANLTAAEKPVVKSIDFSSAVATITKEEPAELEPTFDDNVAEIAAPKADVVKTYSEPVLENYINIAGRTISIENVDSTAYDAGNHVNKYGKFLYGHNSSNVFGYLDTLNEGETFSVTISGVTVTYRIQKIVLYEKVNSTTLHEVGASGNLAMKFIAQGKTSSKGTAYDLSIMTCAGTSYGNGDASHRLVLFANAI